MDSLKLPLAKIWFQKWLNTHAKPLQSDISSSFLSYNKLLILTVADGRSASIWDSKADVWDTSHFDFFFI